MDERKTNTEYEGRKHPALVWLENFWYHYKIHTLVVLFIAAVLIIILVQIFNRVEYDVHVIYAGTHYISGSSRDGDIAPHLAMVGTLEKVADDYNNDGDVNVNLLNYYIFTSEEAEEYLEKNPNFSLNESKMKEEKDQLTSNLLYGSYYVYFLSEGLYLDYESEFNGALFEDLTQYADPGYTGYEFAEGGRAVYLRSLPLKDQPILAELPDDTVVCLRAVSEVSEMFGRNTEDVYRASQDVIRRILSFGINNK